MNVSEQDCADVNVWCAQPQWPPQKKPALFCGFDDFTPDATTAGMVKTDSLSVFISMFVGEFLLSNIFEAEK